MNAWSYTSGDGNYFLTKLEFVLNDGTTKTVTSSAFNSATN
jgi:hypothetical protein